MKIDIRETACEDVAWMEMAQSLILAKLQSRIAILLVT
jgi:hypothetical protein